MIVKAMVLAGDKRFQYVRVKPQGLVDLLVRFRRPPTAAPHQLLRCVFANEFRQHLCCRLRPGEIPLRPLRVIVIQARGTVIRYLFCYTTLPLVCLLCGADDPQILATRRYHGRMQAAVETRHHAQAGLAVIVAGVFHNDRRVPIEFGDPLE